LTSFLAALEFLTRIRVRKTPLGDMRAVAASQAWFPAVGLLIGAMLVGFDRLAQRVLPEPSVDVLLVVALAAITGGLHLDGLADAADGLVGGGDRERRLEIMRDVHAGSHAVVAIVCVLALKWAGLAALPRGVRTESLLLTPCLARLSMVVTAAAVPYARPNGLGVAFHDLAWPRATSVAAIAAAVSALLLFGWGGLLVTAFAAAGAISLGLIARSMVGGMTGDLYGATIEIMEALVLLFVAALAGRGWLSASLLG
jgi:adenosylcobinamide-GDP ribazoletransferase